MLQLLWRMYCLLDVVRVKENQFVVLHSHEIKCEVWLASKEPHALREAETGLDGLKVFRIDG